MSILVGNDAIDFTAKAVMPDNTIRDITLCDYIKGMKCVLFFYPLNFTFVCPSEILAFSNAVKQFNERKTKILGVSVDSEYSHLAWKNTPVNNGGIGSIHFPLISDLNKTISQNYGVLIESAGVALRGTFLIDKDFVIRHSVINDLPLGRSVNEALRMVDALDHHTEYGEVCPADWHIGEVAMKPTAAGVRTFLTNKHAGMP